MPRSPGVMPRLSFRSAEMGSHGRKMVLASTLAMERSAQSNSLAGRSGQNGAATLNNVDAQMLTKSGDTIDCLVSAATIDMHGDPCVLWDIQDITERRHTELELITTIIPS